MCGKESKWRILSQLTRTLDDAESKLQLFAWEAASHVKHIPELKSIIDDAIEIDRKLNTVKLALTSLIERYWRKELEEEFSGGSR